MVTDHASSICFISTRRRTCSVLFRILRLTRCVHVNSLLDEVNLQNPNQNSCNAPKPTCISFTCISIIHKQSWHHFEQLTCPLPELCCSTHTRPVKHRFCALLPSPCYFPTLKLTLLYQSYINTARPQPASRQPFTTRTYLFLKPRLPTWLCQSLFNTYHSISTTLRITELTRHSQSLSNPSHRTSTASPRISIDSASASHHHSNQKFPTLDSSLPQPIFTDPSHFLPPPCLNKINKMLPPCLSKISRMPPQFLNKISRMSPPCLSKISRMKRHSWHRKRSAP